MIVIIKFDNSIENVIYLVNRNYNPIMKRWLVSKGLSTNDDAFCLAEAIQFIFRSAIRNGKEISLYIPSKRVRELIKEWIS